MLINIRLLLALNINRKSFVFKQSTLFFLYLCKVFTFELYSTQNGKAHLVSKCMEALSPNKRNLT